MEIDKNIGRMIILKRFEDMGTRRSLLTLIYEGLQVFLTDHRPWYCRDGPYLVNVLNVINIQFGMHTYGGISRPCNAKKWSTEAGYDSQKPYWEQELLNSLNAYRHV